MLQKQIDIATDLHTAVYFPLNLRRCQRQPRADIQHSCLLQ